MIDSLIHLDQYLFHLINYEWSNVVFDAIFPLYRNKYFWIPVYLFIILFFVYNYGKRSYFIILFLILTAGFADIISSKVIKNQVERVRPCRSEQVIQKRTLVRCGSGYSFTSSHATNHFALSFFLIFFFKRRSWWLKGLLLFWAVSVSFGQVYVGVHYPLDVVGGAILGIIIATVLYYFFNKYFYPRIYA